MDFENKKMCWLCGEELDYNVAECPKCGCDRIIIITSSQIFLRNQRLTKDDCVDEFRQTLKRLNDG